LKKEKPNSMKTRLLTIVTAATAVSYAQNETNVLPLEGNVGIGIFKQTGMEIVTGPL
jgi:hypothetical protein